MSRDADAVQAHYVAALARRLEAAPEAVQRVLRAKLPEAVRIDAEAQGAAAPAVPPRRARAAPPKPLTPLGQLNQHIASATQAPGATVGRPELRSARAFRETWSRLCAEQDVVQAEQRGPENAGPLNSHMLVLRTLGLMRELSPDYLRHFMSHVDTLLWLDQAGGQLRQPVAKPKAPRSRK
jgi:hypothetical protein